MSSEANVVKQEEMQLCLWIYLSPVYIAIAFNEACPTDLLLYSVVCMFLERSVSEGVFMPLFLSRTFPINFNSM